MKRGFFASLVSLGAILGLPLQAQENPVTTGLQLWLKADFAVSVDANNAVTMWHDASPNGFVAEQPDPVRQPILVPDAINGKPAVRFDGAGAADQVDFLDVATTPAIEIVGDISTFFVVRPADFATFRAVWAKTENNLPASTDFYFAANSGVPTFYRGPGSSSGLANFNGVAVRANNPFVYGVTHGETTATHYYNGQMTRTGTLNAVLGDTGQPLRIGSRGDLVTKMRGDIAEVLIYDRALSAEEVTQVTDYLKSKYGILNEPPTVALTSPANNSTHAAPATLTVTANVTDPDSAISFVEFFVNGARVATATKAPFTVPIVVETAGPVTIGAEAVDDKDGRSTRANVTVTVTGSGADELPQSGLALWLKADDGITAADGEPVTLWEDKSGNNNNAGIDLGFAPTFVANAINGKPAVRFDDAVGHYLEVADSESISITGDIASFAVVRAEDFANFRSIWGKTRGNVPRPNDWYMVSGSGVSRVFRGTDNPAPGANALVDGATVPANTYVILGFNQVGTLMTQYYNGTPAGTGQITLTPEDADTPLRIGTRDDFVTQMKGDIAELVIYNAGLADGDLTSLRKYLGNKYGIPWVRLNNMAPTVQLTGPAAGTVNVPATVTLTATAEDAGGSISRIEFFANGALIGSDETAPYSTDYVINTAGDFVLTAVAVDNFGGRGTSAAVTVTGTTAEPLPIPANGLQLWLRADEGVTADGTGAVTAWENYNSENNAVQADVNLAPVLMANAINDKSALVFDGVDDQMEIAHSPALAIVGDISTFFVVNFTDFENYRAVWAKTAGNLPRPNDFYAVPNTGVPQVIRGGFGQNAFAPAPETGALPPGANIIVGWDQAGTTVSHYLNGEVTGQNQITIPLEDGGAPLFIGTRGDLFTRMKGLIAEIVIYNRALTEAERAQLHTYLNNKYGINGGGEQPTVTISKSGNNVTISWPENATNFELEGTENIAAAWGPVSGTTVVEGGMVKVTIAADKAAQYFRLKRN